MTGVAASIQKHTPSIFAPARFSTNTNRTPQSARQLVLRQDNEAEAAAREPANSQTAEFATIVAETAASIDKLSVSEAVMRLDLAHQPVLMFRNSSSGELNVIYRRPDGHIGWIDPTAAA